MKPIELKMKGFMTFNRATHIDFSDFGTSGLFLITGDTGAGKSTIFDAVSYALFGEVSGNLRSSLNPVSDFSKEGEECFVELKFIHRNKSYTVKRNPDYMGKKLRGTGFTRVSKNAVLCFEDKEIKGNNAVTAEIIQILGIDRNQFKQISMLAQGEFMSLLNAESKVRGIILRKIFNTDIYEVFKNKLEIIKNDFLKECGENDLKLIQTLKGLDFDEKSKGFEELKSWFDGGCDINAAEGVIELIGIMNDDDTSSLLKTKEKKEKAEADYKKAELELSRAEADNEIFKRKSDFENERDMLIKEKAAVEEKEKKLDLILRGKNVNVFYQNYLKEEKALKNIIFELGKNEELLCDIKLKKDKVKLIYEEEKKKKADIDKLSAEILRQGESLKDYDELERLSREFKISSDNMLKINKDYAVIEGGIAKLAEKLNSVSEEMEKLKDSDVKLLNCENIYNNKAAYKNSLNELVNDFLKIKENKIITESLEKDFVKAETDYQAALENYENARSLFLSGQAGIMAKSLKAGEACPVCGSLSHPRKAKTIDKMPSEAEIKNLEEDKNLKDKISKDKNNALRESRGKIEALIKSFISQINELLKLNLNYDNYFVSCEKILDENIKLIDNEIKLLEKNIAVFKAEAEKKNKLNEDKKILEERIGNGNNQFEEIKKVKENNEKLIMQIKIKTEALTKNLEFENKNLAIKNIKEKERLKNSMLESLESLEKQFNALNTEEQKLDAVLKENKKNKESVQVNLKNAENKYAEKLRENKFIDEEEFINSSELQELEEELKGCIDDFKSRELKNKASLEEINKNLEGKEFKDLENLTQRCKILFKEKNDIEKDFFKLYKKCEVNGGILKNASELLNSQEKIRHKFLNVNELYKTAGGTLTGKNRISLENYVQAFYFKRIIQEANKRLTVMTDGQYELFRKESALRRSNEAFALDLVVYDYYTGKSRDVSTLSGGEAFKAALSLALGLSDVIQQEAGGIEIDAVFIDEGFGSLDSDSLEQAISVLCELSEGNRLVGIISHVNELKERISKKIIVKKTLDGSTVKTEA